MSTQILLIRHGQSNSNKLALFAGQTEVELSDTGRVQAGLLAEALADEKIDRIYASMLKRTHDTIKPLADKKGLQIERRAGFNEMFFGDWENKPRDFLKETEPAFSDWINTPASFTVPNGETVEQATERFYAEMVSVAKENDGKTIVVTAHGEVILLLLCKLGYFDFATAKRGDIPPNASITRLSYDGSFTVNGFGDNSHLGSSKTSLNL